jgi:hypothetical protein
MKLGCNSFVLIVTCRSLFENVMTIELGNMRECVLTCVFKKFKFFLLKFNITCMF